MEVDGLHVARERRSDMVHLPFDWRHDDSARARIRAYLVQDDPRRLAEVSGEDPHYTYIAQHAMLADGMALRFVEPDDPDFFEIARIAMRTNGMALRYVPQWRPDFMQLAKIAVRQNHRAIFMVPYDFDGYTEVRELAAQLREEEEGEENQ